MKTEIPRVVFDFTRREGLDPEVIVDGKYVGTEDQLDFRDLLSLLGERYQLVGTPND